MRLNAPLVALLIASMCAAACAGRKQDTSIAAPVAAKGVPFSLPKTILDVDMTVVKTTLTPGRFCAYLDLFFFGVEPNADCSADLKPVTKTGVRDFVVTAVGVPNPAYSYLLPPAQHGGWAIDTASGLELSERGLINSMSDERTNRRAEVVIAAVRGLASIAARAAVAAAAPLEASSAASDEEKFKKFLGDWQLVWNFEQIKAKDKPRADKLLELFSKKDPSLHAARGAYEVITDLDAQYRSLLGGQGAVGAATLIAEVRKEIEVQRNGAFLGTVDQGTWTPTFQVDPPKDAAATELILIADCGAKLGSGATLTKAPLPRSIECTTANQPIALRLKAIQAPARDLGDIAACADANRVLKGIPFIVPQMATAALDGAPKLPPQQVELAHWGTASCLTVPGSSYTAAVAYWGSSGAIKTVKFTSKSAVSREAVEALSGAAGEVQQALIDARAKAEEQSKDKDLAALKAQRERLEEKVKIKEACQALNMTCEF